MADPDGAVQRFAIKPAFELAQFAFGAPPRKRATLERGDACGVVAAIFEQLQRLDELGRHRRFSENADNAAHAV
jgi:hypothetical protein